ncbi:MAG: TlpA family protein disulfide reductase [Nitrospina sp.]|jgi:cytochrome c biogenesis protein CcmG/thiol:disulfide interchange protein DsbE|nr:TlpA family protein disulfide reductase [Nitrospina sp.]MDG1844309.1 TlpA disulfide reductase family protein [Nitrospinaceae bacterium]MBT5259160.1 TlpA family protein disulfide reductase [Nitrospina sp.]MBT5968796.1 TlpA family protein disulfide reductase [Nitrospina sp.]MBT6296151.1 TlpA family protein disulfide reductase [Nitrospina sp.]
MYKVFIISLLTTLFVVQNSHAKVPIVGDAAPNFSLTSVDNKKITLADLKGKVVLIGMFHICVPCMKQALEFNIVQNQLSSEKLTILGINTSGDSKAAVMKYLKGFPESVKFSYLIDPDQSVHKNYSQRDMPTVLVIDTSGIIQARVPWVGADQLVKFLKKLL